MKPDFTVIYAFRDRDAIRVKHSLASLQNQELINFEVVFVDYGSTDLFAKPIQTLIEEFNFVSYYYVGHQGLLWNKSKALNFGICKAITASVFIADVDVLFASCFSKNVKNLISNNQFSLFKIGYLPEQVTAEHIKNSSFDALIPKHYDDTFGVGLFSKTMLEAVGGLDPFFHFYGSEDQDLNARLIAAGYTMKRCKENILLHQWHKRYPNRGKEQLTVTPRLSHVQRLNQRHFLREKERSKPIRKMDFIYYSKTDYIALQHPTKVIEIDNVEAKVIHLLNYELPLYKNEVVQLVFKESLYYKSFKYKVKKILGKQTQPYISIKKINDLILHSIVFNYSDYNYAYSVHENLKQITLIIKLKLS